MKKFYAGMASFCLFGLSLIQGETNAIFVDNTGKVGINIQQGENPAVDLDIKGSVNISETLKLASIETLPESPNLGTMAIHKGVLKIFLNGAWNTVKVNPVAPDTFVHETFESGETNFTGMTVVDKPVKPAGGVGDKVGKTNFKATTNKAVIKYHTLSNVNQSLYGSTALNVSLKLGTAAPVHGDSEVRMMIFFDNGKKRATSYKNVTVNHATEDNMKLYEWKGVTVNGGDATKITKISLQLRQKLFPFSSKTVFLDEIKVEPAE